MSTSAPAVAADNEQAPPQVTGGIWVEKLKGIVDDLRATGYITESNGKLYLDSKEVGTLIRAVGIFPSEAQIKKFIEEMDSDTQSNVVEYEKFFRVLGRIIMEDQYKRDTEEKIYRCFLALDKDKKGYLTREELVYYMTLEGVGEPLDTEEMEEMIASSIDPKEGKIYYEEYVYNLVMENY